MKTSLLTKCGFDSSVAILGWAYEAVISDYFSVSCIGFDDGDLITKDLGMNSVTGDWMPDIGCMGD